jgi:poly-beta-hydroxyalkanoate depolymerase
MHHGVRYAAALPEHDVYLTDWHNARDVGREHRFGLDEYVERAKAEALRSFYEEYFAVLDLAAEFYLETVRVHVFRQALERSDLPHLRHFILANDHA